ncbi:hypothetical protein BC830DRAFT_1104423 [Chytriomyces sp. MP71]|nr:hypothetical protein BC830DRAFT_1104423 [Chytriomyces sp. MP71]
MISSGTTPNTPRFLAVLDFEATCDDKTKLQPQEIIEFPVVVIDTTLRTFPIVHEFHQYCKPVAHPVLTPFCTQLTGITQETVTAANSFTVVWKEFLEFLHKYDLNQTNCIFLTCGHWDLLTMLPVQLRFSGISQIPLMQQWCNIKIIASEHLGTEVRGMPFMLRTYKLPLIGRHHSGIDDARNIASIARRLLEFQQTFRVTLASENSTKFRGLPPKIPKTPVQQTPEHTPALSHEYMSLVDIGANLTHKAFNRDNLPAILRKAKQANVSHVMITGTSMKASRDAIALCREFNAHPDATAGAFPKLWCTVGVHPHDSGRALAEVGGKTEKIVADLEKMITENRDVVVAVGECGLDFDRTFSTLEDQEAVFLAQMRMSLKVGMPLFLHERSAHVEFAKMVQKVNTAAGARVTGCVHCFTGDRVDVLQTYLDMGFYIGITGWVTDEREGRGGNLAAIAHKIPLHRLMIETDAPFLLPRNIKPVPKLCEPALVGCVALKLAELYGINVTEVAAASTENATALFGLH